MSATLLNRSTTYPAVTVEFGFSTVSSQSSVWSTGTWNTAKWSGRDVVWTDVSNYLRSVSTDRGKNRDTDAFPAGTCQIVLSNADARFTPANLSGPYVADGKTKIVPKVPVRVRATWDGTTYGIFFGRVNSWQDDYPGQGKDCITTVTCQDVLADLAAIDVAELLAAVGTGEQAGQRISRILNSAGWAWDLDIEAGGFSTMQGTVLGANALQLVQLTAESDGGQVFADGDGRLAYQDPYHPAGDRTSRASTAQITFGSGVGEVRFSDPQLTYDDTLIFTQSSVTREGGTTKTSSNADSTALYGLRTITRTGLVCETDTQSLLLSQYDLFRFRDPEYRVAALVTKPAASPSAWWPLVLDSRFGDYCVVKVPTPSGSTVTRDVFVSGLSHQIVADGEWVVRFGFASATPFAGVWAGWDAGLWDTVQFFV